LYKSKLNWNNALLDIKPAHEQMVVVSVDGIYYLTWYDANNGLFRLKDQPEAFFSPDKHLIYWIEFNDHPSPGSAVEQN
jgi:hypothetical protein